jgi:hypothetical protein
LFRDIDVAAATPVPFNDRVRFEGEGVLALVGDRDHKIPAGGTREMSIRRDGPWVVVVAAAMRWAVAHGIMSTPSAT